MEQAELSCVTGGNVEWSNCLGKYFGIFFKKLSIRTIGPSHSISGYLPTSSEIICAYVYLYTNKDLHTNVNSFICKSKKLKTAQMSVTKVKKISTLCYTQTVENYSEIKKKEGIVD